MKAYKLLKKDQTSFDGCKWLRGRWKKTDGEGELCGPGWLHFYTHPLLAALLNPIHASINDPVLWEAEVRGKSLDDRGLKVGWTEGRIIRKLKLPKVSREQRIGFGILCVKEVCRDIAWNTWADDWLSGKNRSAQAAETAAAETAWAAARPEWAARAAARAAARPEWAAAEAARGAERAAARAAKHLDLIVLAKKAMEKK